MQQCWMLHSILRTCLDPYRIGVYCVTAKAAASIRTYRCVLYVLEFSGMCVRVCVRVLRCVRACVAVCAWEDAQLKEVWCRKGVGWEGRIRNRFQGSERCSSFRLGSVMCARSFRDLLRQLVGPDPPYQLVGQIHHTNWWARSTIPTGGTSGGASGRGSLCSQFKNPSVE